MGQQVIIDGIRQFAQKQGLSITQPDELMFVATVLGEQNPLLIGIELFGLMVSLTFICGALPGPSVAPTLLQKNWGGVEGTCFFFSVNIEQGKAWLNLEARQLLGSNPTPDHVRDMLSRCWMFADQAKEALKT